MTSSNIEYLGFADVEYLDGHATAVAADLFEDGVETSVELSPVLELGVRPGVIRLASHLLALRQHLTVTRQRTFQCAVIRYDTED